MSEALANSPGQQRPTASRTNSQNLRPRPMNSRSTSMTKPKQNGKEEEEEEGKTPTESPQTKTSTGPATSNPSHESKAKRKPRKLAIRNAQTSVTSLTPSNDLSDSKPRLGETKETKETSLDVRVSTLESEYRKLHKRTNSNTIEIGKLQASTKIAPDIFTPSTPQDKTEVFPEDHKIDSKLADTAVRPDDKSKDTRPADLDRVEELSDEEIETIPRVAAPAVNESPEHGRSVALKGSYKIPLPSTLSTDDVRAVQNGIAAASTVAREIATAMRSGRSRNDSVLNETGQDTTELSVHQKQKGNDRLIPKSRNEELLSHLNIRKAAVNVSAIEAEHTTNVICNRTNPVLSE
ncbi:hypothetical protein FKW77_010055 [Venturia effusa]|uniref:Uncharacterized protein n=1 Tax=Venturia effusa TaxID=50376 RepID=A0A517L4B7_9PEZI|nr:hypothetical protein FKW77_010055 [Venturia effusa]